MLNTPDPWDKLLHAIGQGWPHYKNVAQPLVNTKSTADIADTIKNGETKMGNHSHHHVSQQNLTGLFNDVYTKDIRPRNSYTCLYIVLAIIILQRKGA